MKKPVRIIVTVLFLGLYLLSACTGAAARPTNRENSQGVEVVASQTLSVNATETVVATVEDDNANDNSNDVSLNEGEVVGAVETMSGSSITIDGFEYGVTSSTEFKDVIVVGDQVKAHIIINADGTTVVSEIEKLDSMDANGNSNSNSNDDDQVGNSNGNSNDDDQIGNSNGNSNEDDQIGNSNGNSNDDDQVGNSNGNSNDNSGGNSNDNEDDDGGNSNGGGGGGNSNGNDDD